MPKVYNTNYNPNHSYDKAETFGEIIHMSRGYIPPNKLNKLPNTFNSYANNANKDDYLLLSGSNLVCVLAVAEWLKVHGSVNVLQHTKVKDGESGRYSDIYLSYHVTPNSNERQAS